MLQVSSLIFVIAGYRACFRKQFVIDDYYWIQFIQKQFLNVLDGFNSRSSKGTLLPIELPIACRNAEAFPVDATFRVERSDNQASSIFFREQAR